MPKGATLRSPRATQSGGGSAVTRVVIPIPPSPSRGLTSSAKIPTRDGCHEELPHQHHARVVQRTPPRGPGRLPRSMPSRSGWEWRIVTVWCYQGRERRPYPDVPGDGGDLVFAYMDYPSAEFILGGRRSRWLKSGSARVPGEAVRAWGQGTASRSGSWCPPTGSTPMADHRDRRPATLSTSHHGDRGLHEEGAGRGGRPLRFPCS
jgi:hypothetical protein